MNANELSEIIEHLENARYIGASKASEMLRQQQEQIENLKQWERRHLDVIEKQQAEIEALKQIIDANNLSQNIGQFVKAANEPVKWMSPDGKVSDTEGKLFYIPLYTHPAELTDEEIIKVYEDMLGVASAKGRAILRKAQEK